MPESDASWECVERRPGLRLVGETVARQRERRVRGSGHALGRRAGRARGDEACVVTYRRFHGVRRWRDCGVMGGGVRRLYLLLEGLV